MHLDPKAKRIGRLYFAVATALASAATLVGCGSGSGASGGTAVFKLGVVAPMTGSAASFGDKIKHGVNLAVDQINTSGGLTINGKKMTMKAVYCDDQFDPAKAAACGHRLVSQDNVHVIFTGSSQEAFPLASFDTTPGSEFINVSTSSTPAFTASGNPNNISMWFDLSRYMPGFVKQIATLSNQNGWHIQKVATMTTSEEFGEAWANAFAKNWKTDGGVITGQAKYATDATDVYPQLTALLKNHPDAIAVPGICDDASIVVKQARQLGFKGVFIFQSGCAAADLATRVSPATLTGSVFERPAFDLPTAAVQKYLKAYKAKYGAESFVNQAVSWQIAQTAAHAAGDAQSTSDVTKIRAAWNRALDGPYNILEMSDLRNGGSVNVPIHVGYFKSDGTVHDYAQ